MSGTQRFVKAHSEPESSLSSFFIHYDPVSKKYIGLKKLISFPSFLFNKVRYEMDEYEIVEFEDAFKADVFFNSISNAYKAKVYALDWFNHAGRMRDAIVLARTELHEVHRIWEVL